MLCEMPYNRGYYVGGHCMCSINNTVPAGILLIPASIPQGCTCTVDKPGSYWDSGGCSYTATTTCIPKPACPSTATTGISITPDHGALTAVINTPTAPLPITIHNNNLTKALSGCQVTLIGSGSSAFSLGGNLCTSISAGGDCNISLIEIGRAHV